MAQLGNEPRVLMSYAHYPVTVAGFFRRAIEGMGFPVFTVGPYNAELPWAPGKDMTRYLDVPDVEMPKKTVGDLEWVLGLESVEKFKPNVLIQFDAAYSLRYRPNSDGVGSSPPIHTVHVATDPHCINYSAQFQAAHVPVIMQESYGQKYIDEGRSPQWLPYAFDPKVHYWIPGRKRRQDVTMISGLMYPQRKQAVERFRQAGLVVRQEAGLLFEEGTRVYNEGMIAFNWSSQDDLPMRFWEGLAYRNAVLTNRVSDLKAFPEFVEGVDYMAFDTLEECVSKAKWLVDNPGAARKIAESGYARAWIGRHTYNQRALRLLRLAGAKV